MNIFDLVTADNIKAVYMESNPNEAPYVGSLFFKPVKQLGLTFEYIKGKRGTPVALVSSNFDTNVLFRDRLPVTALQGELPYFKEAYSIDERLRQQILSTKEEFVQTLFSRVFDDVLDLINGAEATVERMRMQLLSVGKIAIAENGVNKEYDYGFNNSAQFKTEGTLWSADTNPLKSFLAQVKAYKKVNARKMPAKYCLISDVVLDYLLNDSKVAEYFSNGNNPYPSDEQKTAYIESVSGIKFIVTNKSYKKARDFGGADVPFYPEDRYTLMDTLELGSTLFGTTPEEADLMSKNSKADSVAIVNTGVAVTTWAEVDPVTVITKVSEVVAPTCPAIDEIYIVKVL